MAHPPSRGRLDVPERREAIGKMSPSQGVLLEAAPHLMRRQLGAEAAVLLEARVREMGVRPITGVRIRRIEPHDGGLVLDIDRRDEALVAGMDVIAARVRPRDERARETGVQVAPESGGVVVDDELWTTDPAIHAIGECGSHDGVVYGVAAPGTHCLT